jgi:hypothetical protein
MHRDGLPALSAISKGTLKGTLSLSLQLKAAI